MTAIAFAYRAVRPSGRLQKGVITAGSEGDLSALLRRQGLELIEAAPHRPDRSHGSPIQASAAPSEEDKIAFCGQMRDLLKTGLPLPQALRALLHPLEEGAAKAALKNALSTAERALLSGAGVAKAFSATGLFDPLGLSLLRAGESDGDLAAAFARLQTYGAERLAFKKQVRRAVRYPLFLLILALAVTGFMMGFVLPEMIVFLESLGTALPWSTRALIVAAKGFSLAAWLLPLLALLGYGVATFLRRRSSSFHESSDRHLLALPLIGPMLRAFALARLASSLALLTKAGVDWPTALNVAGPVCANKALERAAAHAAKALMGGLLFSKATNALFPLPLTQRFAVAETCGGLPSSMEEAASALTQEAKEKTEIFLALLEPTLTVLVGGLLAWIVLAVLGPVYGSLAPLAQGF